MIVLLYFILFIISVIALVLVLAIFMKKEHFVKREIVINAPLPKVFDFLRHLKNQELFNKCANTDPDRKWEHKGTDGTVGYVISWSGNRKAGEGEKEILNIIEDKRIETQIRFVKPMKTIANIDMETEYISENQTKVSFSNSGTINYPMNVFIPMAEKKFPKDIDESLLELKGILEKEK